jgi:hypothetical protein
MSTFKRILAEKTRRDYNRKGGEGGTQSTSNTPDKRKESSANMQDPNRSRRGGRPDPFKFVRGRKTPVNIPSQSGELITNFKADANVPPEEQFQRLVDKATKDAKKGSPRGSGGGFGQSKDSAARYAGKPDVAQQAKVADDLRTKSGSPTVRKAASNILGGGKAPDAADELIGGETAKEKTGQRYRQRRPADVRASGVKTNAYADWQREAVRARQQLKATGTKFFGKPTGVDAKGKPTYVPPKETPKGETGRRAQRQASPRSYASVKADLEAKTKIKELKVKPKAPTKATVAPKSEKVVKIELPKTPKAKVTGGIPRVTDLSPSKRPIGTKTFAKFASSGRTALEKQATLKALKTPPKTTVQPKVTTLPKPKAPTKAAVAPKVKAPKITAGRVAGGALSALGAGFDVVQGREDAKKAGASDTRAWLRGAARAAGGLLGGAVGASGGLVGGVAGYSVGSALADKTFTALAGATDAQKNWMKQANLASQKGTAVDKVKYRKGNQAVIYDPRVKKERIGTFDPTSGTFKAANLAKSKAYTAKNPFERLGRQFSRSNEGSGLFGLNIVKGHGLADMAKKYYADKDERERVKRVSDFKKSASTK